MTRFDLSIILPTRNEADNLLSLLPDIRHHLQIAHQSAEVIVVDDGSSDGTPEVVKSFAADSSARWRVRLIQRVGETGLSSAAVAGMQAATGNNLVLMDADHSHPADMISRMAAAAETHDIAIGSRYVAGGKLADDWPWKRRCLSKVATWLVHPLTTVKDPMAGFFALKQSVFQAIQHDIRPSGFKLLLEILSQRSVVRVAELPIHFHQRKLGNSKLDGRTNNKLSRRSASFSWDSLLFVLDKPARELLRQYAAHYDDLVEYYTHCELEAVARCGNGKESSLDRSEHYRVRYIARGLDNIRIDRLGAFPYCVRLKRLFF